MKNKKPIMICAICRKRIAKGEEMQLTVPYTEKYQYVHSDGSCEYSAQYKAEQEMKQRT